MSIERDPITQELKDRQDILDCMMRYCRGVDRCDREMVASAYHPDALDDHGDFVGSVEGFINWAFDYHLTHNKRTQHSISNHYCELDGDVAHTETYWTFWSINYEAPHHSRACGRYIDRLERRNDKWAISARICVMDMMDEKLDPDASLGDGNFFPTARDPSDPSYQRPLMVDKSRITG